MLDSLVMVNFAALAAAAASRFPEFSCSDGVGDPPLSSAIAVSKISVLERSLTSFPVQGMGWDGAFVKSYFTTGSLRFVSGMRAVLVFCTVFFCTSRTVSSVFSRGVVVVLLPPTSVCVMDVGIG